jgi:hypothetical protein
MNPMQLKIPKTYLRARKPSSQPKEGDCYDFPIFLTSLFLKEFLSNVCILVLNSRIGKDNFLAGPIVTLYVLLVFRRPLNNPFVLTMACLSAGDWGKANVAGYPGFDKQKTCWKKMFLFWCWLLTAQLLGAAAAAHLRNSNDAVFGSEFVNGAAWGSGQLYLRANLSKTETCWNTDIYDSNSSSIQILPTKLLKSQKILVASTSLIQWRWWFAEDLVAVLFFIVGYIHIWRWLRWQDMKDTTADEQKDRYWRNLVAFSTASASMGLMTTMTFPTAHYGVHTSVFLSVYQSLNEEKAVTANFLNEPFMRVLGGAVGCILAVIYERAITWVDDVEAHPETIDEDTYSWTLLIHKVLYISKLHITNPITDIDASLNDVWE